MEWRVRLEGGEEQVAESTEELRDWFHFGKLRGADYVYHSLDERWMRASEVSELQLSVTSTQKVNQAGAWCPSCHNRNSYKTTEGTGCAIAIIALVSCGLGLLMIPFLPKSWHCKVCGNEWRA